MKKMAQTQKQASKVKLESQDITTIIIFLGGFLFAVTDMSVLRFIEMITLVMSPSFFTISYFIIVCFLIFSTRVLMKNTNNLRISKEMIFKVKDNSSPEYKKNLLNLIIRALAIFSIAYFIGTIITILNAYTMTTFKLLGAS